MHSEHGLGVQRVALGLELGHGLGVQQVALGLELGHGLGVQRVALGLELGHGLGVQHRTLIMGSGPWDTQPEAAQSSKDPQLKAPCEDVECSPIRGCRMKAPCKDVE